MKKEYRVADELGKQRSISKLREFADDGAECAVGVAAAGGNSDGPGCGFRHKVKLVSYWNQ